MDNILILLIPASLLSFFLLKNIAVSIVGGLSISSQDNILKIKGKVASLSYNSKLLYGDIKNKNTSTNSILQSNSNYSLKSVNGHIQITGSNLIIKLNNKKLN